MHNENELLTIGYNSTDGEDTPVLTVGRMKIENGKLATEILNHFYGEEAEKIHKKLTGYNGADGAISMAAYDKITRRKF